ncbi:MAG TPA: hypothetical protein VLX92_09440 [Kofleriaceae bacterium]|nr:hypothetical protein [Kofleriaceae bacterium]
MRAGLLALVVACGGGGSPSEPTPDGTWAVTLTFSTGTCTGLPPSYAIAFQVGDQGGSYTFAPGAGLQGDTIDPDSSILCASGACELALADSGPGGEEADIDMQTLTATLDEDGTGDVTGDGSIDFLLSGGASCTQGFDAAGAVTR